MQTMERVTDLSAAELIGDLCAPEGSRHWSIGMRFEIQKLLDQHKTDHELLEMCWTAFVKHQGWKELQDAKRKPFQSLADFCKAKRPHGLGRNCEEIDALLQEGAAKRTAQAMAGDDKVKPLAEPNTTNQHNRAVDDVNGRPAGNSTAYLVRRLKRDRPDVAEALARGEYRSARAAAKAAGIVRDPSPLDLLRRAWKRASKKEREAFMDEVGKEGW